MLDSNEILDIPLEKSDRKLVKADQGKRFTNYFIDRIILTISLYGITFALISFSFFENWLLNINRFADYIFSSVVFALLYFAIESLTGGKSIGKYITKTRVLTVDGKNPSVNQYLIRSFSRIVPFEAFSFISDVSKGWHDNWSDTIVIDETKSGF